MVPAQTIASKGRAFATDNSRTFIGFSSSLIAHNYLNCCVTRSGSSEFSN